jgi:cytochrome c-type biogenesis protein CcmF
LGEPLTGEPPQWSFRVYHKPFVSWIWLGAVFMVLGGGLAAFDRRYRQAPSAARAPGVQADMGMGLGASGVRGAAPAVVAKGAVS